MNHVAPDSEGDQKIKLVSSDDVEFVVGMVIPPPGPV